MSSRLEPLKQVKCTYKDCYVSFDTEKDMKRHKRYAAEHNYCYKCDEDFPDYDELCSHKAFRPDKHDKACRVCGEEFKSVSGLRRHIELSHRVDQKLPCVGCGMLFHRACLLVEHLEFGSCDNVSAVEFRGHIVHKYLVSKLLEDPTAYQRFLAKISKYDAAVDVEEEGGVDLMSHIAEDMEARELEFEAIEPEIDPNAPTHPPDYPPLPAKAGNLGDGIGDISSRVRDMDLSDKQSTNSESAWSNGNSSKALFPKAKNTPTSSEWSVAHQDAQAERHHGVNILSTRFWDPASTDWNADRFLNPLTSEYYCPFVCEQHFPSPLQLNQHILGEHRIARIKCPCCHKEYKSVTALVTHCESRGSKCRISQAEDFNKFLDRLTGGFLSVKELIRPDHLHNPSVKVKNPETNDVEYYTPPTATYLQYEASKPAAWKGPDETKVVGPGPHVKTIEPNGWTQRLKN